MRKILAVLLILSVLLLVVGCSKTPSDNSSVPEVINSTASENDSKTESKAPIQNQELTIDTSSQIEAKNPLTGKQVKEIFEPLLEKAITVYESIENDCGKHSNETVNINGNNYALVTDENLKTIDDVWNYAYSAYTKEAAQRLFTTSLDQNYKYARYLEHNGKLYYYLAGHGHVVKFPIDTMEIIKQYEDMIIVKIDFCCYDYEPEDSVFVMCKTDDGWRMANSENEAVNHLTKQFLN